MSEPTDEMKAAFIAAAGWPREPWRFGSDVADGLTAVLTIVEREQAAIAASVRLLLSLRYAHHHRLPGIWDRSGAPCAECAARKRLADHFTDQDGAS